GVLEPPEVSMDVLVGRKVEYRVADELPRAVERYVAPAAYDLEVYASFGQELFRNEQVGHVAPASGRERGGVLERQKRIPDFPVFPFFEKAELYVERLPLGNRPELVDFKSVHYFIISGMARMYTWDREIRPVRRAPSDIPGPAHGSQRSLHHGFGKRG